MNNVLSDTMLDQLLADLETIDSPLLVVNPKPYTCTIIICTREILVDYKSI
jgi:hypothetical protein